MGVFTNIFVAIFAIPAVVFGLFSIWYLFQWMAFGIEYRLTAAGIAAVVCILFAISARLIQKNPAPTD